jgi:hypothetical protein
MPNYNRKYSVEEFQELLAKYQELIEIRDRVVALTGEEKFDRILLALDSRISLERKFICPPRFTLNCTPSKRDAVVSTWDKLILDLINQGIREESVSYLASKMGEMESIYEALDFVRDRKNFPLDFKDEKTFKRTFQ